MNLLYKIVFVNSKVLQKGVKKVSTPMAQKTSHCQHPG